MKRIILTIIAISFFSLSFAQENKQTSIDKSKLQFNLGVGLSTWGVPFYIGADYWLTEDVTVGVQASLRYRLLHSYRFGYFGGSVNANFHFNNLLELPDDIDAYAGVSAGPYVGFGNYYTGASLRINFSGQIGGRYKINEKLWLHGELGGGSFSGALAGITIVM